MIGDKEIDHEVAGAVASYDFPGGNLDRYVEDILADRAAPVAKQFPQAAKFSPSAPTT